jgi:GNAT superfamily N-acetyltransferase
MRGFLEREELTEAELVFQAIAGADRTTVRVLAEINGQPVGGAGHAVREGVGMFYGDSTLVNFRGRGIQTALIRERLKLLRSQGAELAAASVIPGSISQRNYERCGFVVAYTKVAMLKDLVTS